ncbi:MAG: lipopolysaccharide biosynthesis protein [Planctomycetota bacterium]|jgi:PST family polysaccharide transporter
MPKDEASDGANLSADRLLDTEHLKGDLKGRAIRGGAVTMVGQVAKFFVRVGSLAVLGRLLTEAEFGVFDAMVVVTEFVLMFKDMGLAAATIQRPKITRDQISTLFWINVAISLLLTGIVAGMSPVIAWWNKEPELLKVAPVLAIGVFLGGLAIQHHALLRRQMRFTAAVLIELSSISLGIVAAIVAALLDAGYWSLVIMNLVSAATLTAGVWIVSGWCPGRPRLRSGVRSMLNFGKSVMGYRLVNYFAKYTDRMLLGRYCGLDVLGLYGRAYGLLMLPITQITRPMISVALPALSRIKDDPQRFAKYYQRMVQLLAFAMMPLVVFLSVCARNVIPFVLGDKWAGAAVIFHIFTSSSIVLGFIVGIRWGVNGVAVGYAVASYVALLPGLWYAFRRTPVKVTTAIRAIVRPAVASSVTGVTLILVYRHLQDWADIAIIGICFVIAFVVYLLAWLLMPGGIGVLRDFAGYIAIIYKKEESSGGNERVTS